MRKYLDEWAVLKYRLNSILLSNTELFETKLPFPYGSQYEVADIVFSKYLTLGRLRISPIFLRLVEMLRAEKSTTWEMKLSLPSYRHHIS